MAAIATNSARGLVNTVRRVPAVVCNSEVRRFRTLSHGEGFLGALGHGSFQAIDRPQAVPSLSAVNVLQVAAGWAHSAAVTADGQLLVWGRPYDFRNALRLHNMHRILPFMARAVNMVSSSADVILEPTVVPLEGLEVYGEGNAEDEAQGPRPKAASVSCSAALTVVVTDTGEVQCMGQNRWGQCGLGSGAPVHVYRPERAGGEALSGEKVVKAVAGLQHVLVLCESGAVYGWGKNESGQLGTGEARNEESAVRVPLPSKAVDLDGGLHHGVAVLDTGEAYLWGKMLSREEKAVRGPVTVYHDCLEPLPAGLPASAAGGVGGGGGGLVFSGVSCASHHSVLRTDCGRSFMFGVQDDTRQMVHDLVEVDLPPAIDDISTTQTPSRGFHGTLVAQSQAQQVSYVSFTSQGPHLEALALPPDVDGGGLPAVCVAVGWQHTLTLLQ